MNTRWVLGGVLAIFLGVGVAWGAAHWWHSQVKPTEIGTLQYQDTLLPQGGDFTVETTQGQLSLSELRGKVVVLYLGYTACPDVCPTSMATIKQAFNLLKPEEIAQVQGLFISVDPERDSLEQVNQYAQYFHPAIRGASTTVSNLEQIARQYEAFFSKVSLPNSALGYMMDHTSTIYVLDKQGHVTSLIQHAVPPNELAAAVRRVL